MMSVLHKFLGTSVLLPSLSAASNLVQSPLAGAPPPSFYAVLQAVHLWVDTYKVRHAGRKWRGPSAKPCWFCGWRIC